MRNMPRRRNNSGERELVDVIDRDAVASEVGSCVVKKMLCYPGVVMSMLGFGGSIFGGNLFNLSFLNRWLHLGKWKWVLHSGLLLFGLIGLALIWCSFPGARAAIKKACCGKCMKRKKQYDRLREACIEEGEIPS